MAMSQARSLVEERVTDSLDKFVAQVHVSHGEVVKVAVTAQLFQPNAQNAHILARVVSSCVTGLDKLTADVRNHIKILEDKINEAAENFLESQKVADTKTKEADDKIKVVGEKIRKCDEELKCLSEEKEQFKQFLATLPEDRARAKKNEQFVIELQEHLETQNTNHGDVLKTLRSQYKDSVNKLEKQIRDLEDKLAASDHALKERREECEVEKQIIRDAHKREEIRAKAAHEKEKERMYANHAKVIGDLQGKIDNLKQHKASSGTASGLASTGRPGSSDDLVLSPFGQLLPGAAIAHTGDALRTPRIPPRVSSRQQLNPALPPTIAVRRSATNLGEKDTFINPAVVVNPNLGTAGTPSGGTRIVSDPPQDQTETSRQSSATNASAVSKDTPITPATATFPTQGPLTSAAGQKRARDPGDTPDNSRKIPRAPDDQTGPGSGIIPPPRGTDTQDTSIHVEQPQIQTDVASQKRVSAIQGALEQITLDTQPGPSPQTRALRTTERAAPIEIEGQLMGAGQEVELPSTQDLPTGDLEVQTEDQAARERRLREKARPRRGARREDREEGLAESSRVRERDVQIEHDEQFARALEQEDQQEDEEPTEGQHWDVTLPSISNEDDDEPTDVQTGTDPEPNYTTGNTISPRLPGEKDWAVDGVNGEDSKSKVFSHITKPPNWDDAANMSLVSILTGQSTREPRKWRHIVEDFHSAPYCILSRARKQKQPKPSDEPCDNCAAISAPCWGVKILPNTASDSRKYVKKSNSTPARMGYTRDTDGRYWEAIYRPARGPGSDDDDDTAGGDIGAGTGGVSAA